MNRIHHSTLVPVFTSESGGGGEDTTIAYNLYRSLRSLLSAAYDSDDEEMSLQERLGWTQYFTATGYLIACIVEFEKNVGVWTARVPFNLGTDRPSRYLLSEDDEDHWYSKSSGWIWRDLIVTQLAFGAG